jgi:hypothetical protein
MFTTNNSSTRFFNGPRIAVFNGTNYDEWALSVEMALGAKACWDIVSRTIVCPAVPAVGASHGSTKLGRFPIPQHTSLLEAVWPRGIKSYIECDNRMPNSYGTN